MPNITWIVVANSSRARVLENRGAGTGLTPLQTYEHPESRVKGIDLASDRPGHTATDRGSRTALEPDTDPKRNAQEHFAHELAQALEQGRVQNRYQDLILVASSPFLGVLRSRLPKGVKAQVREALNKDYTAFAERELAAQLGAVVTL